MHEDARDGGAELCVKSSSEAHINKRGTERQWGVDICDMVDIIIRMVTFTQLTAKAYMR